MWVELPDLGELEVPDLELLDEHPARADRDHAGGLGPGVNMLPKSLWIDKKEFLAENNYLKFQKIVN